MYNINEHELENIASGSSQINVGFLGIAVGAFVALLITVVTVDLNDRMFPVFVAITVLSGVASVYFGLKTKGDLDENSRRLAIIKERRRRIS